MTDEDRIYELLKILRRISTHCQAWQHVQKESGLAFIIDREIRTYAPSDCVEPKALATWDGVPVKPPRFVLVDLDEWDRQHDELHAKLMNGREAVLRHFPEQINRMEVARRVLNAFAVTGKVEVPE